MCLRPRTLTVTPPWYLDLWHGIVIAIYMLWKLALGHSLPSFFLRLPVYNDIAAQHTYSHHHCTQHNNKHCHRHNYRQYMLCAQLRVSVSGHWISAGFTGQTSGLRVCCVHDHHPTLRDNVAWFRSMAVVWLSTHLSSHSCGKNATQNR